MTEDGLSDADLQSSKNCEKEELMVYTEETCHDIAHGTNTSFDTFTFGTDFRFSYRKITAQQARTLIKLKQLFIQKDKEKKYRLSLHAIRWSGMSLEMSE